MSTLPGPASKGEKVKQKFQSLDINSLLRSSRGESSEKQQQKSTVPLKHGMQILGKVPSTRRAPANLPSLKSEHSGSDAAVSLVPSGGPGWGKQDANSSSTTTPPSTSTITTSNVNSPNPPNAQLSAHQAAIAIPATTPIPTSNKHTTSTVSPAVADKSWSAVMSNTDYVHPPPYQSPQFQHEFPSLSSGDGGPSRTGTDIQYGPGPSLRPQTEGSWMQGGSRAGTEGPVKTNSAPVAAPPQLSGQVGLPPQQPINLPTQFRGVLPQFMYRGNFPANGHGAPVLNNIPAPMKGRNHLDNRSQSRSVETDEVGHRPIIKEEDLSRMDDMTRDVGWASHDDIDYNQKLAFSDDESVSDKDLRKLNQHKEHEKAEMYSQDGGHSRNWSGSRQGNSQQNTQQMVRGRTAEEEEVWIQRRRQHSEEVAIAVERAKQRKEEEEKRFLESKQNAAKKLQELEEKLSKGKRDKEQDESQGTINPSVVPPQPIVPTSIPVPEWERDRGERDTRSRTPSEISEEKMSSIHRDNASDFRKLTQIEGKNVVRKVSRSADRDTRDREQNGPNFPKQFQVPPRFLKLWNNTNSGPQSQMPFYHQYESHGPQGQLNNKTSPNSRKPRQDVEGFDKDKEDDRRDYRRQGSDDSYRSGLRAYSDSGRKSVDNNRYGEERNEYRSQEYDFRKEKDEEKWERHDKKEIDEHTVSRQNSDEWHIDRRDKYRDDKLQDRYERPQRPDSRESRASRESRHSRESARDSEPREYIGSWADAPFEPTTFEDKKKDHFKDDRRQVPGPITKDRIEADDLRSEKKNLTQLKRGQTQDKKGLDVKKDDKNDMDDAWTLKRSKESLQDESNSKAWADAISPSTVAPENPKFMEALEKPLKTSQESLKQDVKKHDDDLKKREKSNYEISKDKDDKRMHTRPRNESSQSNRSQGWGGGSGYIYHRSSWTKRSTRGSRSGGPPRPSSAKSGELHGTDSEGSLDEMSVSTESGKDDNRVQKSPKPVKKFDKDERNKEIKHDKSVASDRKNDKQHDCNRRDYVPRGEPSRHGRGGASFRTRNIGISKRIDGYGPPPSKSPFGHLEDKEKKLTNEEIAGEVTSSDEKTKHNQQVLSAGISGSSHKEQIFRGDHKSEDKIDRNKQRKLPNDSRRLKPKSKEGGRMGDDNCDTTSDNSDESTHKHGKPVKKNSMRQNLPSRALGSSAQGRRNNPPPRLAGDKRPTYGSSRNEQMGGRQNIGGMVRPSHSLPKKDVKDERGSDSSSLCNAIADISIKNKENVDVDITDEIDEKCSTHGDSDGFQEVRNKKTVKERQKPLDDKMSKPVAKMEKDGSKPDRKNKINGTTSLTQQQISSIPSLMATPVNPPAILTQPTNKGQFERPRQNKLPPRLAKQRENNRLQKVQMQQGMCDVNDMNKVNQNMNVYGLKDASSAVQVPISNAWDKPLTSQLRGAMEQETILTVGLENCKNLEQVPTHSQSNSPNSEKIIGKSQLQEKAVLDGTTPPVNTIIFENTNFKSAPGARTNRNEKPRSKLEDTSMDNVMTSFNKPINDLLNKNDKQPDSIIQLAFNKEDNVDMKLDFFESELSQLTEDKTSKNLGLPRSSIHAITSANNTISPSTADALNFKIASVKKVWETMPTVIEHSVVQDDSNSTFPSSFGPDPNSLDPSSAFSKGADTPDDNHEGYSQSSNQSASNSTTNVCKVKPTQQVAGSTGQTVLSSGNHQQHSSMVGQGLMSHPLSPPPIQPVLGAGVGLGQPPQQYTTNQHIGYQANLGGSNQYGMSAIPSPPNVLFNSTQQLQAQTGLYGFQIDQTGVLGGQGRSQYSQYPNPYSLGQTGSSPYSGPSMYLQTAQPHPPPTQAPPDLYQNMNNYRLSATAQFGQNQQLSNPTTVLISSTSNSLMSATVKPSSQQISAIGTKAGGVGQAYQQQSQQGQQLYMTYDPSMQASYLPSGGVMQRGPGGPVQNNVVPTIQPSSSYYSGSTGGQTGYFQQPGNSTLQSAQLQQHQAGYGLQGNVFGTHNQSHTSAGLQSFSSHFLSTPIQIAAAAALNAQQYRSPNLPSTAYMKGVNNQSMNDQGGRPQQIKSPGSQQEVLSSVFNSGPQIPSPKSRQNCKQPPPQPSPTAQHKYNLYQSVTNQQSGQGQRYPAPIQRPVNFQPSALSSVQNNHGSVNNQKHRSNPNNKQLPRQYYTPQGNALSSQVDKCEDNKISDIGTANTTNSSNVCSASLTSKTTLGNTSTTVVSQTTDISKDSLSKEDTSIKD